MALTRSFRNTVEARLDRDSAFRQALLAEAMITLSEGDLETGRDVLRDFNFIETQAAKAAERIGG